MRPMLQHVGMSLAVVALSLSGCGEGESPSTPAGAVAPVVGKPVGSASQLEGTWFRRGDLSDDQLVGLEFAPNGETITFVSADINGIRETTFPFTFLDGGRIRVSHPQFPTESQVAVIKLDGSALSLEPQTQSRRIGMIAADFDRLSGKSIPQRLKERIGEILAQREALQKEIMQFIGQTNLVLLPDGDDAARIAVNVTEEGGLVAYQRIGQVVIARQAGLSTTHANDGAPGAALQLGAVVGPPGAVDVPGETIRFEPRRGNDGSLILASSGATLRPDTSLHRSVKRDYDTLFQARRKIIDAFHDRIGHFLFLQAEPTNPNNTTLEQIACLRVDGTDTYRVANVRSNVPLLSSSFTGNAVVQLANDEARLRTNTHQILPEADGAAGAFIVSTRSGARRFTTLHRMSREQLDARRAACDALVQGMKSQPLQLVGVYQSSTRGRVRPVRLALTSADGQHLAGTFYSEAVGMTLPVTGEIAESMLGLILKVSVPKPSPHAVPDAFTEAGTLTLNLEFDGDTPVLTGRSHPGDSTNRFTFAPPSADSLAALRQAFHEHLKAGGHFRWDRTGSGGGTDEVFLVTLADDGKDGVVGTVGFRRERSGATVGRLSESDGLLILDLAVQPAPGDTASPVATGPMRLYVTPFEGSFQLSGYSKWDGQTRTRYVSYTPASSDAVK